jgi:hypothetical protein
MDLFQPVTLYPGDGSDPIRFCNLRLALIAVMTGLPPGQRERAVIGGSEGEIGYDDIRRLYHDLKPLSSGYAGAPVYTPAASVLAF